MRGAERPIRHLLLEATEINAFIFFLAWRRCGEDVASNHPGLGSTISWDFGQIAYLSEAQFHHLQKAIITPRVIGSCVD